MRCGTKRHISLIRIIHSQYHTVQYKKLYSIAQEKAATCILFLNVALFQRGIFTTTPAIIEQNGGQLKFKKFSTFRTHSKNEKVRAAHWSTYTWPKLSRLSNCQRDPKPSKQPKMEKAIKMTKPFKTTQTVTMVKTHQKL